MATLRDYLKPVSETTSRRLGVGVFCCVSVLLLCWAGFRFGLDIPPSGTGDEPSYDSMSWEIIKGNGFTIDYTDLEFRSPYEKAVDSMGSLYRLPNTRYGVAAFRPPLLSTINAGLNLIFGRQFFALRSLNILFMAGTAGLLISWISRKYNLLVAGLLLAILLLDVRFRLYARAILTEACACFLCTLLTLTLLKLRERDTYRHIIAAGVLVGLSILTRTIVILWLPGLSLFVFMLLRRFHSTSLSHGFKRTLTFAGCTLLVISPWAIRNIQLLGTFAPMGTQGMMELSAGYSDIAWENHGVWQNLNTHGFFDGDDFGNKAGFERELAVAEVSRARAMEWTRHNVAKLPALAAMKVANEFWPREIVEGVVLLLMLIGIVRTRKSPTTVVLLGLLLTNVFAIAVTWSVLGRFLVPQMFVMYALAAASFSTETLLQKNETTECST